MKYILLNNGIGIIISDERRVKTQIVKFVFLDAPLNATVMLKTEKGTFYRMLSNDKHSCEFNVGNIKGIVDITVSGFVKNRPMYWNCESVFVSHDGGESVVYAANNPNKLIVKLFKEHEAMEKMIKTLGEKITALEKKFEDSFNDDLI